MKIGVLEIRVLKIAVPEVDPTEKSATQIGVRQDDFREVQALEIVSTKAGTIEIKSSKVGTAEVGSLALFLSAFFCLGFGPLVMGQENFHFFIGWFPVIFAVSVVEQSSFVFINHGPNLQWNPGMRPAPASG